MKRCGGGLVLWRKWAYVGAIAFTLVSGFVFEAVDTMSGEMGCWLRFASGVGIGLPSLLVGFDLIISPEKAPVYDFLGVWRWHRDTRCWRYERPSPRNIRRYGFSLLIFSALVFCASIQQWQADLVYGP